MMFSTPQSWHKRGIQEITRWGTNHVFGYHGCSIKFQINLRKLPTCRHWLRRYAPCSCRHLWQYLLFCFFFIVFPFLHTNLVGWAICFELPIQLNVPPTTWMAISLNQKCKGWECMPRLPFLYMHSFPKSTLLDGSTCRGHLISSLHGSNGMLVPH